MYIVFELYACTHTYRYHLDHLDVHGCHVVFFLLQLLSVARLRAECWKSSAGRSWKHWCEAPIGKEHYGSKLKSIYMMKLLI